MTSLKRLFILRPVEPNRGDVLSRFGLLRYIESHLKGKYELVVLSSRPADELPGECIVVKPGPLKDLIPSAEQRRLYRKGDILLWSCGHDMNDDSSALKLPFLLVKFLYFRLVGLKIHIVAQGAGPLTTKPGMWCVKLLIKLSESASFRDEESLQLIRTLTGKQEAKKTYLTADTALLSAETKPLKAKQNSEPFVLGINLRRWFHFDGHWMPYEYRVRSGLLKEVPGTEKMNCVLDTFVSFIDEFLEKNDAIIRFIPMYPPGVEPWEDDLVLMERVKERLKQKDKAESVSEDLSCCDLLKVFGELDGMIGVRLHSTIAATVMGVPAIHIGYSPKGLSYFKRMGKEDFCLPIESCLKPEGKERLLFLANRLIQKRDQLSAAVSEKVNHMKKDAAESFFFL